MAIDPDDPPRLASKFTDDYATQIAAQIQQRCYESTQRGQVAVGACTHDLVAELLAWRTAGAALVQMPAPVAMDNLRRMFAAASRELALRKNVFPKRVADKRMTQVQADDELNAMTMIVELLRAQMRAAEPVLI